MMESFIVYMLSFSICLFTYRLGIKDGRRLQQNKDITNIIPKQPQKEPQKDEIDGLMNILNYDGDIPKGGDE